MALANFSVAASTPNVLPVSFRGRSGAQCRAGTVVRAAVVEKGAMVLVAGSTGGVGQIVVAKLVERGYKVRALTRNLAKAKEVFKGSDVEAVELDLRDAEAVKSSGVFDGCQAALMATGTTAFPSDRWNGNNGPRPTDYDSPRNFISAAPSTLKHFVMCTSTGVDRYKSFPFVILNLFGVLILKKASEDFLKQSGLSYTIVRPGRLTDGPYTSYDLNTLLKATSENRQDVELALEDTLTEEASRIATAELMVQALLLPSLKNLAVSISSKPGEGPGTDSDKWEALLKRL